MKNILLKGSIKSIETQIVVLIELYGNAKYTFTFNEAFPVEKTLFRERAIDV
jgi:hypothetical protein